MNYTLHLPPNYTPPPLPGRDEWVADLRANPDKQCRGFLTEGDGTYCCLGRLVLLQNRLRDNGSDDLGAETGLSCSNPLYPVLAQCGVLPRDVTVGYADESGAEKEGENELANLNDSGLSFAQIADIIEQVWSNGGPLLK